MNFTTKPMPFQLTADHFYDALRIEVGTFDAQLHEIMARPVYETSIADLVVMRDQMLTQERELVSLVDFLSGYHFPEVIDEVERFGILTIYLPQLITQLDRMASVTAKVITQRIT